MCTWEEYKESVAENRMLVANLKSLMSSLSIGLIEAMNLLKLNKEKQQEITELLAKESTAD